MYIYKLTNSVNGLSYIGATKRKLRNRLWDHWTAAGSGRTQLICRAIQEFGKENFAASIIGEAKSFDELMLMEIRAIRENSTLSPLGYNMTSGGKGALDRRCLESTRLRISEEAKRRTVPDSVRAKIAASLSGRVPWNSGKKTGPAWNAGVPASEETKKKLRGRVPWNKGVAASPESRAKMSASHTGAAVSAETRAKMSTAHRGSGNTHLAKVVEVFGVTYPSIAQAARETGLSSGQILHRIRTGQARYCGNEPDKGIGEEKK